MSKPLYELNLPPAAFFIGQVVRVLTKMEERDENGELLGAVSVIGQVVESDSMYLTLGQFSELEGNPIPKMAIKHDDIQMIRVYDAEEEGVNGLQGGSDVLN